MKRFITCVGLVGMALASPALTQTQAPATVNSQTRTAITFLPGMRSIKMAVDDFDKAISFYTALGMKPGTKNGATQDLVWEGATSQNSGITMAGPAYGGRKDIVRGGNYLMVMTPDVKAVVERLRRAGFPDIADPRAMGTMVSVVMLRDPDGNRIELMGPLPGK